MSLKGKIKKLRRNGLFLIKQILGKAPKRSKAVINTVFLKDGRICLSGRIYSNYKPQVCFITIRKFRDEKITNDFPVEIHGHASVGFLKRMLLIFGLRWTDFSASTDFPWATMPSSIYGLGFKTDKSSSSPRLAACAAQILTDDVENRTYCIFTEQSVQVPRIEVYHFGRNTVDAIKNHAATSRPTTTNCVIGEYTNTARDNGKSLFEKLKEIAPEIRTSYIVEQENMDAYSTNTKDVLPFGSPEHLLRCLDAQVCAFTHHRSYVYPNILKMLAPQRYSETRTLFLQHGIIAMKKSITPHYHYSRVGYDAFCVSSNMERDIITRHFGYPHENVVVTGLARFDQLYEKSKIMQSDDNQILIFPTWRQGLEKKSSKEISELPFVRNWQQAMSKITQTGVRTVLILHPMLQRHASLFSPYVDEVRETKEFRDTLVESSALITDYSSVCFDALFLEKPVFLYQFDQHDSGIAKDAFIDIETQMPGLVSQTPGTLIDQIASSRSENWRFSYTSQRELYFASCDNQNAARIKKVIERHASYF